MSATALARRASGEPKRRHRGLVWSLIVVASVLLVVSITANWVQRAVLDTDEVVNTSDEILKDKDVQEELSFYLVDQLYANVDVSGAIEEKLPNNAARRCPLRLSAATRQLALNVSQRALASPRVQALVSDAIRVSHRQFVGLIEDKGTYVSKTGGVVALEYGQVIADLATRLGVDPATISNIQSVVRETSKDLKQRLTTIQGRIKTARADLAQVRGGHAELRAATGSRDAADEQRRAAGQGRGSAEEGQGRPGQGPGRAAGPPDQARGPARRLSTAG